VRYGRTVEEGFLPCYSVDTEEEAERLLVRACPRNVNQEFVARELCEEQTLDRLFAFGERLARLHRQMKEQDAQRDQTSIPAGSE
jgi:hypothetical protein